MPTIVSPATSPAISEASFAPANRWTVEDGREYVVIEDLESLDPFFLSLVGAGNQWFFCSSTGSLSAGRQSPETALFPYYTVDKITDNWNNTGPWTALLTEGQIWSPLRPPIALLSPFHRRLMKSPLGDELLFDEVHDELGLRFTYRWQLSNKFGFVRTATLTNIGGKERSLRMVDGIDNFLPSGIDSRMQLQYSCLADAYKMSELDCGGHLMVHRLAAGITDQPIPLENMRATTVWMQAGGEGPTYMSRRDAEEFLRGQTPKESARVRGNRGAMFVARELTLAPGESWEGMMVAEIEQTQAQVSALKQSLLTDPGALCAEINKDIEHGRERLHELVAMADGFQETADRDTSLYHYHNTLANILRGGVPEKGYSFDRDQFLAYLAIHNRRVLEAHRDWLEALPESLAREDLLARLSELGDHDLHRLGEEYLPLILSRRHGDPSRPWNRFFIRLENEDGEAVHHFEGNWRDIFQNWEALAWSYPAYLDGFISKFLNASTVDGFNPYRVTSEGVDWEVPDKEDPWSSIGYWGDHQIIYLLKLLELESRVRPDHIARRLDAPRYVFADVPYRLRSWEETLADPRNTVEFDEDRHALRMEEKGRIGADGLLLRNEDGEATRVTLAEKLLLPAVVKLANLVPGGGIWMNTQRPEWNDANNALAGCGLSVVTAAYLYRYLGFVEEVIGEHPGKCLHISPALSELIEIMGDLFSDERWSQLDQLSDHDRFALVETAGRAVEDHRKTVYQSGPGEPKELDREVVLSFLRNGRHALRETLRHCRREDGLWHSYNILKIGRKEQTLSVDHLAVMLEGQVAILSSTILSATEALEVLEALPGSDLRSARHGTYLLYPDRDLPGFLEANRIEEKNIRAIGTLATMADGGDTRLLVADPAGGFRFQSGLTNGYALAEVLAELAADDKLSESLKKDRAEIEALYESVFNHLSFTGRSGSMFGYEGLGCIYWHMVSKLMLAAQKVTLDAVDAGADDALIQRLTACYYEVQGGLGFRQSPEHYGAFPAEPYSHSPSHAGAQQPGLTGQVKEGILCRFGELGVRFQDGTLSFRPRLLRDAEFAGLPSGPGHTELAPGTISFTVARTPVVYHRREGLEDVTATAHIVDGSETKAPSGVLDQELTAEITQQTGKVARIEVEVPAHWLVS